MVLQYNNSILPQQTNTTMSQQPNTTMPQQSNTAMLGQAKGLNENLGALVNTLKDAFPLHATRGLFTMAAAASKVVAEPALKLGAIVFLSPLNAAAATLMSGSSNLYFVNSVGVGFTVYTADGGNAAGTELFAYMFINIG